MNSMIGALASTAAGVVLALVAVLGGVSAITPSANSQAQTDGVVVYDGR